MGARLSVTSVKGLSMRGYNSTYTSYNDAFNLGQKSKSFQKDIFVILVTNMLIPCPGAPPKFSILLSDY